MQKDHRTGRTRHRVHIEKRIFRSSRIYLVLQEEWEYWWDRGFPYCSDLVKTTEWRDATAVYEEQDRQ